MSELIHTCGKCRHDFVHGATVCQGCHRDIFYGASRVEIENGSKVGAVLLATVAGFVVFWLPSLLNDHMGAHLKIGYGLGLYSILPVCFVGLIGYLWGGSKARNDGAGKIRTF